MTTVLWCLWKLRDKFIGRTLPKFTQNSPPNYTCSSFIQIWYVSVPGISRLQLRAIRRPFLVKSKHCNPTPGQKERNTSWELSPRSGLLEEGPSLWGCGEGTSCWRWELTYNEHGGSQQTPLPKDQTHLSLFIFSKREPFFLIRSLDSFHKQVWGITIFWVLC